MWPFFSFLTQFQIFSINCRSSDSCIWATRAVVPDLSKAFDRVWYAGHLRKFKSCGISSQIFGLILSFLSNEWFWMGLLHKAVNAEVPQGSVLCPALFLLYINDFSDDVTCNTARLMILPSTLIVIRHLICGNN